MYSICIYKQPEVWTMEVVDMTRLPLWDGCAMLTHTLNTLLNLVEQAVYALLPAHLTPSNFTHMTNLTPSTPHIPHPAPRPLTPTRSHMVRTTGPAFMHGVAALCTLNTSPHESGYINIALSTSHIYSTSLHPHPYNTPSTPHTPHPTLLHYIHLLTQHPLTSPCRYLYHFLTPTTSYTPQHTIHTSLIPVPPDLSL